MCKSRVTQWSRFTETWLVQTPQGNLIVRGWDEALFLAQLLADPHEYVRAVGEAAWDQGIEDGLEGFYNCNPYRKEQP